jgi:hypothetical protein
LNEEDFEIEEDSYTKGTPKKSRLNVNNYQKFYYREEWEIYSKTIILL